MYSDQPDPKVVVVQKDQSDLGQLVCIKGYQSTAADERANQNLCERQENGYLYASYLNYLLCKIGRQ